VGRWDGGVEGWEGKWGIGGGWVEKVRLGGCC